MEVKLRMNCPHCGADTKNAVTICPLCGNTLDRENAFQSYVKKGDAALAADETDKAIMSYKKALEYSDGNDLIFLKLGNAYDKKGDKQAAGMYMKALTFNFYNDNVHNMLIALYSKYGKLDDLKKWYEQSREKADAAFVDKYIKLIRNIHFFKTQTEVKTPAPKKDGLADMFFVGMKKYIIMNIVVGIVLTVVSVAVIAGLIFKVDTSFILAFTGLFLAVTIIMIILSRHGKAKKKDSVKQSLAELMAEEMAKASNKSEVISNDAGKDSKDGTV